jgi:hypothetical protein
MHVAHIMLVSLDKESTEEDALNDVADSLDDNTPDWSDWHNAYLTNEEPNFAGRWAGHFFGKANTYDCLRYSDNPELAEKAIAEQLEYRKQIFDKAQEEISNMGSLSYDPYDSKQYGSAGWYLSRMGDIYSDNWTPDSYVYDLQEWTASLMYWRERVTANPNNEFLVVVDFHF